MPKLDWTLIPWLALAEVVRAMEAGNAKPGRQRNDWKRQPPTDARRRHTQKLLRHVIDYAAGQRADPETGLHPLAHAAANCLILLYFECRR